MGRHQENITRLVCGAITCAVSFCLLTCAFYNTAYAVTANTSLPNTDSDINGGSYNPTGYLFGTDGNVFTDTWYSDESIFFQTLSGTFQLVQDKSAIYTAVVADLVRQGNNLTAKTNYWLSSISNKFSTLLDDTGNILFDLRFSSYSVNGTTTKTIRGIVKDISDAMVTNNASLQQIKEQFEDDNGSNYLSQIRSNTRHIDDIWNQLANGTSGTISGTVNGISGIISRIEIKIDSINTALGSGGYIGQQLASVNTNLSNIYTALTRTQHLYQFSGENNYRWVYEVIPTLPGATNSVGQWMSIIRDNTTGINSKLQDIVSSLGSGGYIGQQLADMNATLTTIKNNLTQYTYNDSNGGSVRYFWVASLMPADPVAQQWMTNVRNYLDNIRDYSSNLSAKIDLIRTDVSSIVNALGSGGYIGQQLANVNASLSNIYTALTRTQHEYQFAGDNNYRWVYEVIPTLPGATNSVGQWMSIIRDNTNGINSKLQEIVTAMGSGGYIGQQLANVNASLSNIYTVLTRTQHEYQFAGDNNYRWVYEVIPTLPGATNSVGQWMSIIRDNTNAINSSIQEISRQLANVNANISNIYTALTRTQHQYQFAGDNNLRWVYEVIPTLPGTDNTVGMWMSIIRDNSSVIISKLNDILLAIQGLDLVFNIPTNWPDIIGDFDDLDFGDKVDDLIDELENLAPFGAIFLISNQINLLTQVDPLTDPSFVMDFNFAGTSENLTLDVSWLNDAKPLFNFITIFLLMYSLLIISMKYVRQEATS